MARKKEALGRRAVRTGFSALIGNIIGLVIGVATIVVLARLMGPSGYGGYTIAVSYYLLVDAAVNYGIGQYLSKKLSDQSYRHDSRGMMRSLSMGFVWSLAFGIGTALLGIGVAFLAAGAYASSGISFATLAMASLVALFAIPFGAATYALVGMGEGRLMAITSLVENGIQLLASALLVVAGYGIDGAIAGIVIGYFCGFVVAFAMMLAVARKYGRLRFEISRDEARSSFRFLLHVSATNIMNNAVGNFATLFLGVFVAAAMLGNYGVAMRAIGISSPIYAAIPSAIIPIFSIAVSGRMSRRRLSAVYNKAISYSMLVMLPIFAFIGVLSVPIVYLFLTTGYGDAPFYLSLIALGTMVDLLGVFASGLLTASGKTQKLVKYTAASAVAQLVALVVLVPHFGAVGAIVALFFVGSAVSTYFLARGTARAFGIRYDYLCLGRIMQSTALFALALVPAYLIGSSAVQLVYGAVLLCLLYPFLLVATGALKRDDIRLIRRATGTIRGLALAGAVLGPMERIARK